MQYHIYSLLSKLLQYMGFHQLLNLELRSKRQTHKNLPVKQFYKHNKSKRNFQRPETLKNDLYDWAKRKIWCSNDQNEIQKKNGSWGRWRLGLCRSEILPEMGLWTEPPKLRVRTDKPSKSNKWGFPLSSLTGQMVESPGWVIFGST
jgi:hypothetical protein